MATVTITILDQDNGTDLAVNVESDAPKEAPMTLAESAAAGVMHFLIAHCEGADIVHSVGEMPV